MSSPPGEHAKKRKALDEKKFGFQHYFQFKTCSEKNNVCKKKYSELFVCSRAKDSRH